MAEAVGWAQMQVAQAVVAVKRRPEPVSAEPIPTKPENSVRKRKTAPKQLSLTALFQFSSESGLGSDAANTRRRAGDAREK
jgi:hypothetical protein